MPFDPLFTLLVIVVFLTMVTLLVAAHELGHYLFAKWFGMEVEEFSIGFGKKAWTYMKRGETVFTVRPWPLGGFVRIKGMMPEDDGSEIHVPGGFYSKAPWKRFLVLFAGPLFSVLAGFLVLIPLFSISGARKALNEPLIGEMAQQGPAYQAGIRVGDRVLSIDGQPIETFYEMVQVVRDSGGLELRFVVQREGEAAVRGDGPAPQGDFPRMEFTVKPTVDTVPTPVLGPDLMPSASSKIQSKIAIGPARKKQRLSLAESTQEALLMPVRMVASIVGIFKQPTRFSQEVGGPITMVAATAETARTGLPEILTLCGLLSISLGIFNLLPIAPLDGGQMMIALAEMLRGGRRLSLRVQSAVSGVGFALVMLLIVSVLVVDVNRFFGPRPEPPAKERPASGD